MCSPLAWMKFKMKIITLSLITLNFGQAATLPKDPTVREAIIEGVYECAQNHEGLCGPHLAAQCLETLKECAVGKDEWQPYAKTCQEAVPQ